MKSFTDIQNTLGETADNLKDLCCSQNINKYSFYKPISSTNINIYDADIYADNDGLNLHSWPTWVTCLDNQTYDWTYKNRSAPYRLGDFNGYNHYADPWFSMDLVQGQTVYSGGTANIMINDDIQNFVAMYKVFEGWNSDIDLCYIIYDTSSSRKYLYKFCNVQDLANYNTYYINIDSDFIVNHTYKIVPILTSATRSWQDRTKNTLTDDTSFPGASWWSFPPESYITFLVDETYVPPTPAQYLNVSVENMMYNWNDPVLSDMTFDVVMTLGGNMQGDVVVTVEVWYDITPNEITPQSVKLNDNLVRGTLNILGTTSLTFNCYHRDDIYTSVQGNYDDRIPVRIEITYTYNGTSHHQRLDRVIEHIM